MDYRGVLLFVAPLTFWLLWFLGRVAILVAVDGGSMLPTLRDADVVLAVRYLGLRQLRRGQIVVIRQESTDRPNLIKRVVAVHGDWCPADPIQGGHPVRVPFGSVCVRGDAPPIAASPATRAPIPLVRIMAVHVTRLPRDLHWPKQRRRDWV